MTALYLSSAISAALVILLTGFAALADHSGAGQSIRASMAETWTNIVIGFSINYVANLIVLPMAGHDVTMGQAFHIGVIFTAIAIVRTFFLRRVYNRLMVRGQ